MSVFFLSYDRESRASAESLADDIRALGHVVWFDQELSGGQHWWDKILQTIRDCDVFVPVLTPRSLNSTACEHEQRYAIALNKPILPVLAAEGVSINLLPPALTVLQFLDYRNPDRGTALRLARGIAGLPPAQPLPAPLPEAPQIPTSYLGGVATRVSSSSMLTYEQQSALLVDLRGSLRDPEAADDTRSLLRQFRKRRDLLATIAEEVDELLAPPRPSTREASLPQSFVSPTTSAAREGVTPLPSIPISDNRDLSQPVRKTPSWRERLFIAAVCAVLGALVGTLCFLLGGDTRDWGVGAAFAGIGGAITGAIGGKRWHVLLAAVAGAGIGMSVSFFAFYRDPRAHVFAIMGAYGAPGGALLGSVVGLLFAPRRGRVPAAAKSETEAARAARKGE